jgi:hypothetical protein
MIPRAEQKKAIDEKVAEIIKELDKIEVNVGETLSGTNQEEQPV